MARYVLQWKSNEDCAKETLRGPIYLDTAVNYVIFYQSVSLSAL